MPDDAGPGQPGPVVLGGRAAADYEELRVADRGQQWAVSWHPPDREPPGKPHGVNAWCVTSDGGVVLISPDGQRWGWPGGRPHDGEEASQTLRREVLEETCSTVVDARVLGFTRSECLRGPEEGLVLARGIWRAEVRLLDWDPQFEIPHRRVVPATRLGHHLWMEAGFEPIYRRALREAGLA